MKKGSAARFLSLGVTVVLLTVCFAADTWCQEDKIGVVDMTRVIDQSKQGIKAMAEMAAKLKGAESDLEKRQSEIVRMKQDIEKNAMILTSDALAKKERQYQDRLIEYQRKLEQYQYQLSARNQELDETMQTLMAGVLETLGPEGYLLILEKTSSGVLYNIDSVDLTDEVIDLLNKK